MTAGTKRYKGGPPVGLLVAAGLSFAGTLAMRPTMAVAATVPDITGANWYWGPGNRWSYRNTRRIFPNAEIRRESGPVAKLDYAIMDIIDGISFKHPTTGAVMTIPEMYSATDTDAFLVLKDGKIVTERYFNGMTPEDQHILMSVSKSVLGSLTGIIVAQGRLDPEALVTHYIPELKGSAYEGATVRNLLDMSVGVNFDENYSSKTSDLYRLDEAAGWVPRGPSADGGLHKYLSTLTKRLGAHGSAFRYASPHADAMAWVLERATNTDYAELLSKELWSKLGAERDAFVLLDGFQAAYSDPGLNMTLRDLGRFAQMMLQNGVYNGQRIVPEEWIQDIRHGGDSQAWKNGPAYSSLSKRAGYKNGSYRSFWYVADPQLGRYSAIGLAGQLIVIDPATSTVIVKFSSHSTPAGDKQEVEYAAAAAIVDALSAQHRPSVNGDVR
jgi:CubicO group peptidase (beta-lactamase class C family)